MPPHRDSPFSLAEWAAIWSVVIVWGVNNAAGKAATAVLPPLLVGGMRFAVALAFLFPFIRPPFPPWRKFLPVLLLTGPLHFAVVYWGFALAHNLSLFSVTLQLWIPFAALLSWALLGETMPPLAIAGLAAALAGVVFLTLDPKASADVTAITVGAVASGLWAMGAVLVRKLPPIRALKLQGCVALVAAPVLITGAFITDPQTVAKAQTAGPFIWGTVVYAGLASSVGATVALFWLVQRREAGRFAPYLLTTPLVTSALGVSFFGDVLSPRLLIGSAVTLGGVAVVALAERRRSATRAAIETAAP